MLLCLTLNNPQSRRIPLPASPARSHRPDAGPRIARPSAGFRVPSNADAGPSAGGSPTGRLGSHRRRGGTQTEPNPDSDSWIIGAAEPARNPSEMGEKVRRRGGRQIASPFLSARYCASARKDRSAPRSTSSKLLPRPHRTCLYMARKRQKRPPTALRRAIHAPMASAA